MSKNLTILGSQRNTNMPKTLKKIELEIAKASTLELIPGHKYLMILPKDAKLNELQVALAGFFPEVKIFCIAVNDVSQYKIAELLQE